MSRRGRAIPALESALVELRAHRCRFEVFARSGTSTLVRLDPEGEWEHRENREVGVGCRVSISGASGFAAASGQAAVAGKEAARAAVRTAVPGPDPIPPGELLGYGPALEPFPLWPAEQLSHLARRVAAALDREPHTLRIAELRILQGAAESFLVNSDGFTGRAAAAGASLEMLLAPRHGPWRLVQRAYPDLTAVDPERVADQAREAVLLAGKGEPPSARRLTDILLAPAAAAPLVEALGRALITRPEALAHAAVSPVWRLVDERPGPNGLLGLPFDGEGFPARPVPLLADGRLGERAVTWRQAQQGLGNPGGASRPSYRRPPETAPANLVVRSGKPLSGPDLLAALHEGVYAVLPAGPVHVDWDGNRFRLPAAGVTVRRGRPVRAHPVLEIRGTLKGLLRGLTATGDDDRSFSFDCAVTTPSLLFRRLEVA